MHVTVCRLKTSLRSECLSETAIIELASTRKACTCSYKLNTGVIRPYEVSEFSSLCHAHLTQQPQKR